MFAFYQLFQVLNLFKKLELGDVTREMSSSEVGNYFSRLTIALHPGFPRINKRYQCEGDHCQGILGVPGRSQKISAKQKSTFSSLSQASPDLRAWLPSERQSASWSSLVTRFSTSLAGCRMSGFASCPSSSTGSSPSIRTYRTTRR